MTWDEFARADPELAKLGFERIDAAGLILLGTLRKNGFPRISPVEALFVDGYIELGMMWRSPKALDLLRDPRCTVHRLVSRPAGPGARTAARHPPFARLRLAARSACVLCD